VARLGRERAHETLRAGEEALRKALGRSLPHVDPANMTKADETRVQAQADAAAARAAVEKHFERRPQVFESPRVAR